MDDIMEHYKGGYKFSNGLPMSDELKEALDKFCDYAKQQGDTRSKEEVFKECEILLTDALKTLNEHSN